jgi:hypothetical protein
LRPGAGRKPLDEKPMGMVLHVRLSPEQKTKVDLLGGSAWVRDAIDKAKLPSGGVK